MFDARDAIETCSGLWGEEKDACYAIFGVDPGAEAWFDTVYMLEENLALETGRSIIQSVVVFVVEQQQYQTQHIRRFLNSGIMMLVFWSADDC